MHKLSIILFLLLFVNFSYAQVVDTIPATKTIQTDSIAKAAQDTVKETRKERREREKAEKEREKYYFKDIKKDSARLHIEELSRKAWRRSLVLPGWGQYTNGGLWWVKVPVIYGGLVAGYFTFDYWQFYYRTYLTELQYRSANNGETDPNGPWAEISYSTDGLIRAKDNVRRNRDLVILATVGWYGLNVLEAYVNSMLKYRWDMSDNLSFKVSPTFLPTYGTTTNIFQGNMMAPGIKFTMNLK
ncbi:DUF5683 domain-containing protein [Sphingobacterium hungaricum]|uniref:DUF5683 domain-containing protein n=1 Tax=Sphingobacterium hungaricum TaxID=2082723 RepID=A0A928UWE6_9SPHI|nr:DUF5683 domain-containing protein [Sphingobacterium hungaricum]MBE8713932.1 hypothetical protein [Sphingobacterium hungaricum]